MAYLRKKLNLWVANYYVPNELLPESVRDKTKAKTRNYENARDVGYQTRGSVPTSSRRGANERSQRERSRTALPASTRHQPGWPSGLHRAIRGTTRPIGARLSCTSCPSPSFANGSSAISVRATSSTGHAMQSCA